MPEQPAEQPAVCGATTVKTPHDGYPSSHACTTAPHPPRQAHQEFKSGVRTHMWWGGHPA